MMNRKNTIFSFAFLLSIMAFPVMAGNALFDAQIKSFDRNIAQFDKVLKVERYGNARWEKKVSGKKLRLTESIKKIEKKFPEEDVSFLWETLAEHSKEFDEKLKITPIQEGPAAKTSKPNGSQDKLYLAALKPLNDKLKRFEKLVNNPVNKTWLGRIERDRGKLKSAIQKIEKNWPKKDTATYWEQLTLLETEVTHKITLANNKGLNKPPVNKKRAKHVNSIKVIDANFQRLDSYMKQNGYGESTWDKNLRSHASSLNQSIKVIENDLPKEAKEYFLSFQSRINLIKIKNKEALTKAETRKVEAQKKQSEQVALNKSEPNNKTISNDKLTKTQNNAALVKKVAEEQKAYIDHGHIEIWDNSTGNIKRSKGEPAYLSFSNDYATSKESKTVFSGKDYIYANLNLPKKLSGLLPKEHAKGLQYYRVTIIATVKSDSKYNSDKTQKNGNKLQRVADFKLGYTTDSLSIAVVPERGYFENILDQYRDGDKFSDNESKTKGHRDLLSRNFSRQLSLLFKKLPAGSHQVNIEFQVTAKLKQEKFYELKNMKGTFLLEVDDEAKERYKNTFDMLTKLYRSYESEFNVAVSALDLNAEKKKLEAMSPLQRECFHIAKRSPVGYMACYKGAKSDISFHISPERSKAGFIDITWPKGKCERCMAGSSGGIKIRKNTVKTLSIPNNAKVSINGRTLIKSVTSKKDVILYWFY